MIASRMIGLLKSLRFTIFLIICLTVLFLLGQIIPQKDLMGGGMYQQWKMQKPDLVAALELLGLTDIFVAPITIVLWCLFFLNLITVMSSRIPSIWRKCINTSVPKSADALKESACYGVVEGKASDVTAALSQMRYKIFSEGGAFRAVRNRFAPLATVLFHVSFLILLIGGLMAFYTRFRAEVDVAVGETFVGQYDRSAPPKIGTVPKTSFRVDDVKLTFFKKDLPLDISVMLTTKDGPKTAAINRPYREGNLFFLVLSVDVAPLFVIEDDSGRELDGAYVKLKGLMGNENVFEMAGYDFKTIFYTDILASGAGRLDDAAGLPQALKQSPFEPASKQHKEVVNPAFNMRVSKKGNPLAEKILRPGEAIEFDGHRLVFSDLTYWVRFYVGKEHGLGIVYTGLTLLTLALIIRFLLYRRDLTGIEENGQVHIAGRAEYFPALFSDDFDAILKQLKGK